MLSSRIASATNDANCTNVHPGLQGREAAFEPLAALLLHPETLRHLGADSHGATNADDGKTCSVTVLSWLRRHS